MPKTSSAHEHKPPSLGFFSPFIIRVASALVMAPLTLVAVWQGGWIFHAFLLLLIIRALYEWVRLARRTHYPLALSLLGAVYILSSAQACWHIQLHYPFSIAALFLCMVWLSDSGAYVFGKWVRGPKLAQTISPNKTWAGFWGAVFTPAFVFVLYQFLYHGGVWLLPALAGGALIGLVCQSGDLLISLLKRHAGAKDSGQLIPGHGGLLDRIDGLLLAAPVYLWFLHMMPDVFLP